MIAVPFRPTMTLDLDGADGNIFAVVGYARRILKTLDRETEQDIWGAACRELSERISTADSYTEALAIIREYVDLTDSSGKY